MNDEIRVLSEWNDVIYEAASRLGIDPGPIDWRLVDADRMYELAATAMPVRMSHWTHGRDYWIERSKLSRGHGRIYEMIVRGEPPIAYLLEGNTIPAQKLVMAHCLGHADIYRHNVEFLGGEVDYLAKFEGQEKRRQDYAETYGEDAVEWVLDRAYAIYEQAAEEPTEIKVQKPVVPDHPYTDLYPPSKPKREFRPPKYRLPTRDVIGFVARNSPVLAEWERDLVLGVRAEWLYLRPITKTKVIHEGWSAWVQQRICSDPETPMLEDWEQVEMSVLWSHTAVPTPLSLNPYWFGFKLIDWMMQEYGFQTTVEALYTETDASLIRNWLTEKGAKEIQVYKYGWFDAREKQEYHAIRMGIPHDDAFARFREELAASMVREPPEVWVVDVQDEMLVLRNMHEDTELDPIWTRLTLRAIADLWGSRVSLEDGKHTYSEAPKSGEITLN